jgi:NAD(P) transhydrogenase subunit alpha
MTKREQFAWSTMFGIVVACGVTLWAAETDKSTGAGAVATSTAASTKGIQEAPTTNTSTSGRQSLIASLTIFVLAVFVGFEVITKVPPTLHTPLMSGSNAISGITIVGALMVAGAQLASSSGSTFSLILGFIAVVLATVNVVGGFLVTHRMLSMFRNR